jgi:hypothetical protein
MTKDARVFTKTIDGEVVTMLAYTPTDAVQYTYDGWRDITDQVAEAQKVAKQFPAEGVKPADDAKPDTKAARA